MDSFKSNELADISLIEWHTPEIMKNEKYEENCANNPFDIMELKAATMDPLDIVPCQTPSKKDPPCGNILSPLFELKFNQIRKSVSLTDINGVAKILEKNSIKQSDNQLKNNDTTFLEKPICNQPKENVPAHSNVNKIRSQEENVKLKSTQDSKEIDMEKNAVCNEEEKQLLREQTRQHINMLIEKSKQKYEVEYSQKSLFCTPKRIIESSLNKTENVFDRGFIQSCSDSFSYPSSKSSPELVMNINGSNKSNSSSEINVNELLSFDLNSLKPEWIVDNFSDSDLDVHSDKSAVVDETNTTDDHQVDVKLKVLNRIGMVEKQTNGYQPVLKSMQNKRVQTKGPFLANVPLQHMVQNYEDVKIKKLISESESPQKLMPVAASTPTLNNISNETPISAESFIKSSPSTRRSIASTFESPSTPLNVTKCIGKNSTTNGKKLSLLNTSRLNNSTNKRSNTTIVLFDGATVKRNETVQFFKLNKSKSESIIGKIPKPKMSGLPVSKRFTMSFKGKENIRP